MPLSALRLIASLALVAGSAAACSSDPELADLRAPATQAEQARIVALLATDLGRQAWTPASCDVNVLRIKGATTWATARCTVAPEHNGGVEGAWGSPIRVDGDRVTEPEDGTSYEQSIRKAFPKDLADYVLEHPNEL